MAFTHHAKLAPVASSGQGEALAVAVSQGGVLQGEGQFASLPGVRMELHQVKAWLERHRLPFCLLVDAAAQKDVVLNHLPHAAFLHIACHGTFEPNHPDRSGMVLTSSSGQMEIFSLRELSNVPLGGLRHVTLSSCWSADHFILPGRWIISLPQTLWRAGAQSVLGCLWKVDDQVAVSFMASFYAYLEAYPRDEALRRAQLDCLQGRLPGCRYMDTAAPMYWAGYTLYGDYRPLKLGAGLLGLSPSGGGVGTMPTPVDTGVCMVPVSNTHAAPPSVGDWVWLLSADGVQQNTTPYQIREIVPDPYTVDPQKNLLYALFAESTTGWPLAQCELTTPPAAVLE
jgi:hypothetical protein